MPFSPEAEQSVLGAILLDSSCLDRVAEILPRPEYFHQVNNSLIYGAMLEMFTLGQPVDFITVLEKLKESKSFDEASGKAYLVQLAQLVPSISNVETYAKIVRDKYDIRLSLIHIANISWICEMVHNSFTICHINHLSVLRLFILIHNFVP